MTQKTLKKSVNHKLSKSKYAHFQKINGKHPLMEAVPSVYVGYSAAYRPHGKVFYFNFALAKDMGLLAANHPHKMNAALSQAILNAFSLQVINEYDILNNNKSKQKDLKPHQYMATRYLQMQHPNKNGLTSGDGRSIWNGCFKSRKGIWDISSGGTGATRLSPATATVKMFFKSGDKRIPYGCGRALIEEGIGTAITSDIFFRNGIITERILAVVGYPNGTAINVRAARNLLRPAHMFGLYRRDLHAELNKILEYYIKREIDNKQFPVIQNKKRRYEYLLQNVTQSFARMAAILESEYIFCWLEWDGDNVLMDGAIIDYGTIRQLGLFHHEYRYADVEKMSASLIEQRKKAKTIVMTFIQLIDYALTKEKKSTSFFVAHELLSIFDDCFTDTLMRHFLHRIGFSKKEQQKIMSDSSTAELLNKFHKDFVYFEKAISKRKPYRTPDGVTRDAIFCMRDALREFPQHFLATDDYYKPDEFIELISSDYASRLDKTPYKRQQIRIKRLQFSYVGLIKCGADLMGIKYATMLRRICKRSSLINRYERITGDSLVHIASRFNRQRNQLTFDQLFAAMDQFIQKQVLNPDRKQLDNNNASRSKKISNLVQWSGKLLKEFRGGL